MLHQRSCFRSGRMAAPARWGGAGLLLGSRRVLRRLPVPGPQEESTMRAERIVILGKTSPSKHTPMYLSMRCGRRQCNRGHDFL